MAVEWTHSPEIGIFPNCLLEGVQNAPLLFWFSWLFLASAALLLSVVVVDLQLVYYH